MSKRRTTHRPQRASGKVERLESVFEEHGEEVVL